MDFDENFTSKKFFDWLYDNIFTLDNYVVKGRPLHKFMNFVIYGIQQILPDSGDTHV